MGKTDSILIPVYEKIMRKHIRDTVTFFGSTNKDKLAQHIRSAKFFDLQLGNWDINKPWNVEKTSKVICLRTSGFAVSPNLLVEKFSNCMDKNGILMIDWTMGSDHYARDSKKWTWGWSTGESRCYGEYKGKKCPLYSSYLSPGCLTSDAFNRLVEYASKQEHYQGVVDWYSQIKSEFSDNFLDQKILDKHFEVVEEKSWTPLKQNGRAQFYLIQVLRKK